jgi:hypothetical protein
VGTYTAAGGTGGDGSGTTWRPNLGTVGLAGVVIGTGPYGAPGGGGGGGRADGPTAGLAGGASPGFVQGGAGGIGGNGADVNPQPGQGGNPYWGFGGTCIAPPMDARNGGGGGGGGGGLHLPGYAMYRGGGGGGAGGPSYGPSVDTAGWTLGGDGMVGGLLIVYIDGSNV